MAGKDKKRDQKDNPEGSRAILGKDATVQEIQEELSFLRQRCNSMSIRGHYAECIKTIEDNLKLFYFKERWPENFFSLLRLHQKCYPSLNKDQSHEEYMAALLKKNGIPTVFASMLRSPDSAISWTADYFKAQSNLSQSRGEMETALSYSEILIKMDPGSANAYLVKGWLLDDMGRGDEAVAIYKQALELNGGNRYALTSLAKHFLKADPKQAMDYINKAIEQNPGEATYLGIKAGILKRMGNIEGAIAALDAAIKIDPYNADFPYQKAELYLEGDKRMSAIPQYRLAVALNEKHVPSLMRLVEFCHQTQPDLALTYVNTVITVEPENKKACLLRAQLLHRMGEQDAAIKQYRALLELDPGSYQAMGGLGALYLAREDYHLAVSYLENAITLKPDVAEYHMDKARAHQKLKDNAAAIQEYKATVALKKENARAWAELGYLHKERDPKEALDCFTKAITYAPENAYYYTAKGEVLLGMPGDKAKALHCLSLASLHDPGNAELHVRLGLLMEQAGNVASAMEHYKTAMGLDPNIAEVYYRLARLQLDTQPEMALSYINSALYLDAVNGEYYYFKSKVLTALSEDEGAREHLRKAIAADDKNVEAMGELSGLLASGSPRIALLYINRAIELIPDNPAYLCARAHLLYRLGQANKALDQYEKLLKQSPDQHEALFGMARILAGKKDKKALEYFNRAIAGAPAEAEYYAAKAAYLAPMEEYYDEAVATYTTAISLNTQAWQVILQKAKLLDAHGDFPTAQTEYRRVLLLRPTVVFATARMGQLLVDLSPAAARVYLDQAVRLEPENGLHYAWRGKALYNLGEEEAASREFATAITLGGGNADIYFTLATLMEDKFPETALEYCLQAIGKNDKRADFHLLCGNLYTAGVRYDSARACYERAAQLDPKSHDALEKLARLSYLEGITDAKARVTAALAAKPECPDCLYIKACILDEVEEDTPSAVEFISLAVKLAPKSLPFREKLVELLQKKRSFLRLPLEKYRLEQLRKELEIPLDIPEPPLFKEEDQEEELPVMGIPGNPPETAPPPPPEPAQVPAAEQQ